MTRKNTQTKSAYAAQKIRQALAEGRFAHGDWLRAQGIADELGLSLTPVREALLELASEGVIDFEPFRGARVSEIPLVNLSEVYAARGLLESAATGLAAARLTPKGLVKLASLHAAFVKAVATGDRESLRDLNDRFHFAIYDAAEAPLIRQLIKTVWTRAPRDTFRLLPERPERSVHAHGLILEALRRRDPREAEQAMRSHIDEAYTLIREYRESA
jgi:DNA-binding GntR family transcriptional regulator